MRLLCQHALNLATITRHTMISNLVSNYLSTNNDSKTFDEMLHQLAINFITRMYLDTINNDPFLMHDK